MKNTYSIFGNGQEADPFPATEQRTQPMSAGWQPIETAPKDGTKIDLWHPTKGRCTDAFWHKQTYALYEPWGWSNSWWGRITGATHWMPVPAAPSADR